MLSTLTMIKKLQRKLYCKAKPEIGACLVMKNIGKPCTGKPYARFDEGGLANVAMAELLRHRRTKGAETDRLDLTVRDACPLLYPIFRWVFTRNMVTPYFSPSGDSEPQGTPTEVRAWDVGKSECRSVTEWIRGYPRHESEPMSVCTHRCRVWNNRV